MQEILFRRNGGLREYFERIKLKAIKEIEAVDTNSLLNFNEEDLIRNVVEKFSLDPPILDPDNKTISAPSDVDIDISWDRARAFFDGNSIRGTEVTVSVPFGGDGTLFHFAPSTYNYSPPRGEVVGQKMVLKFQQSEHDAEGLSKDISRRIIDIQKYLGWVKNNIDGFEREFEAFVREFIRQRKRKKLKDLELVAKLGIPVAGRDDTPRTYAIPQIKRKPKIANPASTGKPFIPEPALEMAEYENILSIVRNMAAVFERNPSSFAGLKEEDLRNHFLVQLNGQYEGCATGETFNYQGKTDILIRHEGRNAFIAECKFWKGEKGLSKTIDQILGYTSWHDTKTAIFLFNRNKYFSSILGKIPDAVKAHPCFKRDEGKKSETEYRFILHQPDDPDRELILSFLIFNIPTVEKNATG